SSEALGSTPSYTVRSMARPTAWPISFVYSERIYQVAVETSFMCTSKNGKFLATWVPLTPFTGCTNAAFASHSSGFESMNLTKAQATIFCASGLALFTPHIQPYTMVCGFAGLTWGNATTVKPSLIADCWICGVAQGPVIHMASRASIKSWFGLLGVFIVVLGSPVTFVTSRHRVSAFTASGLLR